MPIIQYILNIKQQILRAGILIFRPRCRLFRRAEGSGCPAGGRGSALSLERRVPGAPSPAAAPCLCHAGGDGSDARRAAGTPNLPATEKSRAACSKTAG